MVVNANYILPFSRNPVLFAADFQAKEERTMVYYRLAVMGATMLTVASSSVFATDPSSAWNRDGQTRTHTCTPMKYSAATLRFPDGSPTVFYVQANDPSRNGSSPDCGIGTMEIDAQEILYNNAGADLYFHAGGGPDLYNNYVDNGQYGHIWVVDLLSRPTLDPIGINGAGCSASSTPGTDASYYITPTRVPNDMFYKPGASNPGSTYYTYGNPGYDKTGGRGDWTYISWSWVQNGGTSYPGNITSGGGLVRALGKRDKVFHRCDVSSIHSVSYGPNNAQNGSTIAIYGKTRGDTAGSWIYGWLMHSYQKTGQAVIPCVRRY
jgi:hypothetical protein